MSDEPTDEEVKKLLTHLVQIMVASKVSAPEAFDLCWRDKLHETATILDYHHKNVYVLSEISDGEFHWTQL